MRRHIATSIISAIGIAAGVTSMTGCEDRDSASENLREAADDAGDAVRDAADEVKDAAEDVKDEAKDAVDDR